MSKPKTKTAPEDVFHEAMDDESLPMTPEDIRLLTAGFSSLRQKENAPFTDAELKAIHGMVAYIAYSQNVAEDTVRNILAATFGVADIRTISSRFYLDVMRYLVDLQLSKVLN